MVQEQHAATVPVFSVRINGTPLEASAHGEVTRVEVENSLDCSGTFAIELGNWGMDEQAMTWSDQDLFEPGATVEEYARAIQKTWDDKRLYKQLGANIRQSFDSNLTEAVWARKMINLVSEAVSSDHKA